MRAALAVVVPELADEPLAFAPWIDGDRPGVYWKRTVRVGERWVAKFAWSEAAGVRIARELEALRRLPAVAPAIPVPRLVAGSTDPLLFVTELVDGVPMGDDPEIDPADGHVPEQLARCVAALHEPVVRDALVGLDLEPPTVQATTDEIRSRLAPRFVSRDRRPTVLALCDVADEALAAEVEAVVVHGDLHGHNAVVSEDHAELLLVADFEQVALGDPHHDFRYLPTTRHDLGWFRRVVAAYEGTTGRALSIERIFGWHVRTALGDALWRRELGVALPRDLSPDEYVDDLVHLAGELALELPG